VGKKDVNQQPKVTYTVKINFKILLFLQSDQEVSVHITIGLQSLGAQRFFDHPV